MAFLPPILFKHNLLNQNNIGRARLLPILGGLNDASFARAKPIGRPQDPAMLHGSFYAHSKPRIVPVDDANWSTSSPMRWSIETKRLGRG